MKIAALLATLSPERPVLIAGPTASGKSALAVEIVAAQGGVIVNADAIQVFTNWRVLTARPSVTEEAAHPHALYGHVSGSAPYSVGHWLRDLEPILQRGERPVIVGGTGLYFSALTEGLAQIPATPAETRAEADALPLADLIAGLDHLVRVPYTWSAHRLRFLQAQVLGRWYSREGFWLDQEPPRAKRVRLRKWPW